MEGTESLTSLHYVYIIIFLIHYLSKSGLAFFPSNKGTKKDVPFIHAM